MSKKIKFQRESCWSCVHCYGDPENRIVGCKVRDCVISQEEFFTLKCEHYKKTEGR